MWYIFVIQVLNLLASFASAAWATLALFRPALLSGSKHIDGGEAFYARMYAARAIPLGLVCGILPFCRSGPSTALILIVAATAQLADSAIAFANKDRPMAIAAWVGAIIHVLCGVAVS